MIIPAERRFVSANPLSVPSGQAVYNYKIGLAMMAGSDLTFDVQLVCSNDFSCSPTDGYEGGKCDCVDGNNGQPRYRPLPLQGIAPALSAGEAIGEGGRGSIQYAQIEDNVRYDKVKLTYRWKIQNGTNTNSYTVPIHEVGGKPAYCKWDNSFMSFLCDLGFSQGFAVLQDVTSKGVYYLGENINLTSTIIQKIPR